MCMYLEHFVFRVHRCRDDGRSENLQETRSKRKAFDGKYLFLILQKSGGGDPFAPVPPAQMYVYLTGRSEVVHQLLCGVGVAEDDSCFVKISWFNTRDEYHYFHVMNLAAFSNLESYQNFIFDCEYALAVQGFLLLCCQLFGFILLIKFNCIKSSQVKEDQTQLLLLIGPILVVNRINLVLLYFVVFRTSLKFLQRSFIQVTIQQN